MTGYAESWNRWFPTIERAARNLSLCMLDSAGVAPGHRVLDLATGIGEPALTAAERVGPDGRVLGLDISPEMIDLARARADAAGLAHVEFRVADIETLASPEPYDAVLCRWGLMFVNDLAGSLARMHAALKRGGRLAVAVWAPADEAPSLGLAERVAHRVLGLPPPDEGASTPFALCNISELVSAVERAGFTAVVHQPVSVVFEFASTGDFTAYRRDLSSRFTEPMAGLDRAKQDEVLRAVARAAEDYRGPAGTIRMENRAYCLSAEKGEDRDGGINV